MKHNVIKKDINQLPLAELGRQYLALRNLSWSKHVQATKKLNEDNARLSEKLKQEIKIVDPAGNFRSLGSAEQLELDLLISRFADTYQIPRNAGWFFPQCLAYIAKFKLSRNEAGKISARALMSEHYANDLFALGIYALFIHTKRGELLKNQTSEESRNFSKLVPLIMSAHKQYGNVPYEDWDVNEIDLIVDPNLADCMYQASRDEAAGWLYDCLDRGYLPESESMFDDTKDDGKDHGGFDTETILAWRNDALTVKTGLKIGSMRNPISTYSLSPSKDSPISWLDQLSRHMFLQTWCAHPDNRTNLMVLHPLAWDYTPKPHVDIKFLHNSLEQEAALFQASLDKPKDTPW